LRGQELTKAIAVLIKERLGTRDVGCNRDDIGADDLRVIAQIGFRHRQRILDHRARADVEDPVKAAIERDAGDDRDQDRRHRRDYRKQADDADMQLRGSAAAPARLDDHPDLAPDHGDQKERRQRVGQEKSRPRPDASGRCG
jgi:hypothetical protein